MFSDTLEYRAMLSYVPDWLQKPWLPEISGFYSSKDQVHEFLGQNFVECESMGALRELLLQTDAIAVMPETLLREDFKNKTLKKLHNMTHHICTFQQMRQTYISSTKRITQFAHGCH